MLLRESEEGLPPLMAESLLSDLTQRGINHLQALRRISSALARSPHSAICATMRYPQRYHGKKRATPPGGLFFVTR